MSASNNPNSSSKRLRAIIHPDRDWPAVDGPCGAGKTHLRRRASPDRFARTHGALLRTIATCSRKFRAATTGKPIDRAGRAGTGAHRRRVAPGRSRRKQTFAMGARTVGHILNTRYNERRITFAHHELFSMARERNPPLGAATSVGQAVAPARKTRSQNVLASASVRAFTKCAARSNSSLRTTARSGPSGAREVVNRKQSKVESLQFRVKCSTGTAGSRFSMVLAF